MGAIKRLWTLFFVYQGNWPRNKPKILDIYSCSLSQRKTEKTIHNVPLHSEYNLKTQTQISIITDSCLLSFSLNKPLETATKHMSWIKPFIVCSLFFSALSASYLSCLLFAKKKQVALILLYCAEMLMISLSWSHLTWFMSWVGGEKQSH